MNRWMIAIAGVLLGLFAIGIRSAGGRLRPAADPPRPPASPDRGEPLSARSPARASEAEPAPPVGDLRIEVRAAGKSADGAEVTVIRDSTQERSCFTLPAGGVQTVLRMPEGPYRVGVCHSGFIFASAGIRVEAGKTADLTLDLGEGGVLYGKVSDPSGRPVEGARVGIVQARQGQFLVHDLATVTTASGAYTLEGIPPGTFTVRVRREGYRGWERPDLYLSGGGSRMELPVALSRGKGLAGRVLTESGDPISGAVIMASNEDVAMARSDPEGRFVLQGLGDAAGWASASAEGYGVVTLLGLAPDTTGVEFRLPRAASLSGELESTPKPDRFVLRLLRMDASSAAERPHYERVFTQASGRFYLPGITPGRFRVQVEADGFETQDTPEIDLAPGQSLSDLQVRLQKKAPNGPR